MRCIRLCNKNFFLCEPIPTHLPQVHPILGAPGVRLQLAMRLVLLKDNNPFRALVMVPVASSALVRISQRLIAPLVCRLGFVL